jgi:hypothetical protein
MTKTVALMMVFVFVVATLVGGGVVYWLKPSTNVLMTVTIEQIRNLAELTTCEYYISGTSEQEYSSSIGIFGKKVSDYVTLWAKGTIKGSVSLAEDKTTINVKDEPREISIHFKRGSVIISEIIIDWHDSLAFRAVSCRQHLIRGFDFLKSAGEKETGTMRLALMDTLYNQAIDNGIVEHTEKQAETVLKKFCGTLGYNVVVTFDEKAYDPEYK